MGASSGGKDRSVTLQGVLRFFWKKAPRVNVHTLVVGLGNIGPEYEGTRHNIGFVAVRRGERMTAVIEQATRCCQCDFAVGRLSEGMAVAWAYPRTYMNRSGVAVKALMRHLGISPPACLVVVDDYHLPVGRLRFRSGGSDGGHNGLKSIIAAIGEEFPRLRMGIGPLPAGGDAVNFVLSRFTEGERARVEEMIAKASEAIVFYCLNGIEKSMSRYN
jgi:PTH1 family peptidyl-tRNA hydrolase